MTTSAAAFLSGAGPGGTAAGMPRVFWLGAEICLLAALVHALAVLVARKYHAAQPPERKKPLRALSEDDDLEAQGGSTWAPAALPSTSGRIQLGDLRAVAVVGRGTYGTVQLVHHRGSEQKAYALKSVDRRGTNRAGQQEEGVDTEMEIMAQCAHPCIVQLVDGFRDARKTHLLTEFMAGGDLFNAMRQIGALERQHVHFYAGSITLALEFLHGRGVMYRDLKPENVLLDGQGRAKLSDFGCCIQATDADALVGTTEYTAPEIILGRRYSCAVDWWSLGIMMHEFIVGPLPFGTDGQEREEVFHEILNAPLQHLGLVRDPAAASAIAQLLQRSPQKRLGGGGNGAAEVKHHEYFDGCNWQALGTGSAAAPWVPDSEQVRSQWEDVASDIGLEDESARLRVNRKSGFGTPSAMCRVLSW